MKEKQQYNCAECRWKPPEEYFCGTCIRKILEDIQKETTKKENERNGRTNHQQGST